MKKKEAPNRTNVLERLDHHEKILTLLADRMNEQFDPELKLLAGSIQKNKDDIEGIIEWQMKGPLGRIWFNLKGLWPW